MLGALRGRIPSLAPLGRANLCWAVAKLQAPQGFRVWCIAVPAQKRVDLLSSPGA